MVAIMDQAPVVDRPPEVLGHPPMGLGAGLCRAASRAMRPPSRQPSRRRTAGRELGLGTVSTYMGTRIYSIQAHLHIGKDFLAGFPAMPRVEGRGPERTGRPKGVGPGHSRCPFTRARSHDGRVQAPPGVGAVSIGQESLPIHTPVRDGAAPRAIPDPEEFHRLVPVPGAVPCEQPLPRGRLPIEFRGFANRDENG